MHSPDAVTAARIGDPTMVDPKATVAPAIVKQVQDGLQYGVQQCSGCSGGVVRRRLRLWRRRQTQRQPRPGDCGTAPAAPLAFEDVPDGGCGEWAGGSDFDVLDGGACRGAGGQRERDQWRGDCFAGTPVHTVSRRLRPNDTPGGLTAVGPPNAARAASG